MSDLIRREDVLGACIEEAQKARRYQFGQIWELNYYEIKEAINSIPTAEPKVGRWIKNERGLKCCSVCGGRPLKICYYDLNFGGYMGKDILSKYCPNCGAKMERGNDEDALGR